MMNDEKEFIIFLKERRNNSILQERKVKRKYFNYFRTCSIKSSFIQNLKNEDNQESCHISWLFLLLLL